MNVVLRKGPLGWVASIYSRGVWFRADSRDTLLADVEHMESDDWGYL